MDFIPDAPAVIRLGLPTATGEVLASAFTAADGRWSATLTIPDRLPSSEPITSGEMYLVAMNDQNVALASAPFAFEPAVPTQDSAPQTVRAFLNAFVGGEDVVPYLADPLRAEVLAGGPIDTFIGARPGFQSFTVAEVDDRPSEVLFVRAEVIYSSATIENTFELVLGENT
jgi:hypothetical protein